MFPLDDPACSCCCSRAFVKWNEYQGVGGCNGAVPMSGMGVLEPRGAQGGARGGLRGLALWDLGTVDPDADRPGLGGQLGGWARLTRSSPNEPDSLSDSGIWWSLNGTRIDCVNFNSFAGK